jgi:hypothetical protein
LAHGAAEISTPKSARGFGSARIENGRSSRSGPSYRSIVELLDRLDNMVNDTFDWEYEDIRPGRLGGWRD